MVTLQVALMSYIVFSARPGAADVGVIAILILTGLIGVAMGLLISTLVKNENQASTLLLPIVLPQLLFAGGLVGEKELGAITLDRLELNRGAWSYPARARQDALTRGHLVSGDSRRHGRTRCADVHALALLRSPRL